MFLGPKQKFLEVTQVDWFNYFCQNYSMNTWCFPKIDPGVRIQYVFSGHFQYREEETHLNKHTQLGLQWLCVWGCYATTAKAMPTLSWCTHQYLCWEKLYLSWFLKCEGIHRKERDKEAPGRGKSTYNLQTVQGTWQRLNSQNEYWGVASDEAQGISPVSKAKESELHSFGKSLQAKAWSVFPFCKINLTSVESWNDPRRKDIRRPRQ